MMRADSSLQPGQANSSSTSSSSPEPLQLTPSPEPLPPTTLRTSAWLEAREGYAAAMSNACDHHSMKQVVSYCDDVLILPATEQEPPVHRVLEPVPGTSRISSPQQRTEASAKCSSIQNGVWGFKKTIREVHQLLHQHDDSEEMITARSHLCEEEEV
ncbi:uncharacterized protein LOC127873261 isoform X2 [Dreissena polymorpha]|uniref:uncharacterized protein LOC127873261 isoform X2 n=1 Tax=Dreissena polymorpha TaxID=45954 RepID=UPI002264685D|nr:uncharacterized protein LOC127873261 isoform X2 [Dreissena polymorpha]